MDRVFFFEEVISETFVKNEVVVGGMQKKGKVTDSMDIFSSKKVV